MHTFIWLSYNPKTDNAILMHHIDENKVRADLISKDGSPSQICEIEVKNINWVLKEEERYYLACNTDSRNFPIYMITENGTFCPKNWIFFLTILGMRKMSFDTMKDVTMIEFGFLKDNLMFLLYNEGEQSAVGCYLIQLVEGCLDEDVKISSEDDTVSNITLHPQDDESIMADCFILALVIHHPISAECVQT